MNPSLPNSSSTLRIPHAIALALFSLLCALPVDGSATVVQVLDFDALVEHSDLVIRGTVEQQASFWEGGFIVTETTLSVSDCGRGSCRDREVIRQLGGTVGDLRMEVVGMRQFELGEEVVVFGRFHSERDVVIPVGAGQGIFRAYEDHLQRDLTDLVLLSEHGPVEAVSGIPTAWSEMRRELLR